MTAATAAAEQVCEHVSPPRVGAPRRTTERTAGTAGSARAAGRTSERTAAPAAAPAGEVAVVAVERVKGMIGMARMTVAVMTSEHAVIIVSYRDMSTIYR
jgi:hypothetical protein